MRISVLACAVLSVLAAVGFGPVAPVSGLNDLQCHMGNANETSGICNNGPLDRQFKPTWNKASSFDSESYESDSFRINDVDIRTTAGLGALVDGLVDVHRMTWAATVNAGATGRSVSNTIGRPTPPASFLPSLPASFLPLPFRLSYLADGVYVEPRVDTVTPAQTVVYMTLTILYKLKADAGQGVNQPADISNNDGSVEVWLLFQPVGGFSLTAAPATVQGVEVASRTSSFGPANTLPNRGLGTYYLARRVVSAGNTKGEAVTNVLSVVSGTTLQSVGGPNAPGTTYQVQKLANAFDAPVLTSLSVPAASGAFLTFTLAAIDSSVLPAPGKMFISQAVLSVKSVTPEDGSSTGVAPVATYTLDTSAAPARSLPVGTFVAGTQRLYVRAPGAQWQMVSGSSFDAGTNVVTYSIAGTEFTPQVGSLEMSVQADMPVSSSTGPSSSSSSSAAVSSSSSGVSSSSSAPAAPSSSSSSSSAPPLRSSSSSSSSAAQRPSSSSSSTAASRPSSSSSSTAPASSSVSSSSSSTAPAELPAISSSSTGLAFSSSGVEPRLDGAAASVSTGSIALVVAAAAVAALYA